ncbi:MAG: lysostaphin resistance A-like protein [Akkermansiaceae bacterium]
MVEVDQRADNENQNEASFKLVSVRAGLAPTGRIYRNYAWVIVLACVLLPLWGYFTWETKGDFMQKDYFDEAGTLERYGISMMLAEQSEGLPQVERWLLGDQGKEKAARDAIKYLSYANDEELLTSEGIVTLACLHWLQGEDEVALKVVEPVDNAESLYADALRELIAGRRLDDYTWNALDEQLRVAPRDWVACMLAVKAAELEEGEKAEEMKRLIHERRQLMLVTSAKIAIIDWLVFIAGLVCIVVVARRYFPERNSKGLGAPRLPRLWPLSFCLVVFVLGDFLADFVSTQMWVVYDFMSWAVPFTAYGIAVDLVFRGLGAMLFLWFFLRRPQYVWHTLLRPVPKMWQWVLASFSVVWGIDLIWYSLPADWFPFDPTIGYQWNEYGWTGLLTTLISGVVFAPLFEEFVFRGLLFNGLKNRLGLHASAVMSALAFGFVHFYGFQDLVAVGLFGLVMAYLYHLTRSLWPCILCHALFNLLITTWEWTVVLSPFELWGIE